MPPSEPSVPLPSPQELAVRRSDDGGHRAAAVYTLTETAKLNRIDPEAWLSDVLARLATHRAKRVSDLLPWQRATTHDPPAVAA